MSKISSRLFRISLLSALIVGGSLCCPVQSIKTQASRSAVATSDEAGFEPIFDGRTLNGWEGDSKYWRVENGSLVGEVTPQTILKSNSFIIWRGGLTRDFELKVEYRISARGNSGINYRSVEVPGEPRALRGYQADIDGPARNAGDLRHTGQNYEERGRTFLARRGQAVRLEEGKTPALIATLGDAKELAAFIKNDDWNEYHLIARGNVLVHILNGHTMSMVIDDDAKQRRSDGLLGVQVHVGPPMKVEYRNFRLKKVLAGS
ncbi:MAG TPA: DUF1080 domain-containing protein [Pyrinomonadaceae bacterium]|jgi:hypothetical protein